MALSSDHAGARNVVTTVTKLHLGRPCACSLSDKLMAETNTKNRGLVRLEELRDVGDRSAHDRGITGSIGNEETVVLGASLSREIVVPRADQNLNAALEEAAQLVVLHAYIETQNSEGAPGGVLEGSLRCRLIQLRGLDGNY